MELGTWNVELTHTIEPAASGRAKCRGCGRAIAKGVFRFGERLPNPFAEGTEMTHWFHLRCAAMKRPDVLRETLTAGEHLLSKTEEETLCAIADEGIAHRRLPRIDGAERAPSGRATCRHCREPIEKDSWRLKLVFYEEGMFNPAGYIHLTCCGEYLESTDIVDRIANFSPDLTDEEIERVGLLIAKAAK